MGLVTKTQSPLIGVDISSTAVKLLQLARAGDRYRVEHYAVEPLPPNAVVEKNIVEVEAVGEAIRRAVSRSGSRTKFAAAAVSGSSVITKTISMPSDLDEEDQAAVERTDGSWLLAGYMPADEMAELLGITLPEHRDYSTLAGYLLSLFHHLPATGETMPFSFAAASLIALSSASGPSSRAPVIWPRSAILQSAAASSVVRMRGLTVSTAARIATFGRSIPIACARSIALRRMSALSSSVGSMLIAASVMTSGRG